MLHNIHPGPFDPYEHCDLQTNSDQLVKTTNNKERN